MRTWQSRGDRHAMVLVQVQNYCLLLRFADVGSQALVNL
jgi:hypothetical protein